MFYSRTCPDNTELITQISLVLFCLKICVIGYRYFAEANSGLVKILNTLKKIKLFMEYQSIFSSKYFGWKNLF